MHDSRNSKGIVLTASAYKVLCECGKTIFTNDMPYSIQCGECERVLVMGERQHNFGGRELRVGVPVVASYHWTCPDCGRKNFVGRSEKKVTCSRCGSEYDVGSVTHSGRQRLM